MSNQAVVTEDVKAKGKANAKSVALSMRQKVEARKLLNITKK